MKKYAKNAVKSTLSKPLRGRRYGRLLSISVSALISISTFLTIFPQMSVPVYAAGTGKNIQLGAGALAPKMTSVQDSRDYDTKSRVTTAQTVYYGSKEWRVIGLDGSGAVSESGTVTLFAADKLKTQQSYKEDNSSRSYVNSDIKPVVDGYYSSLFSPAEQNAINARTLANGYYSPVYRDFCDGISDTSNPEVKLWLLSTKEADLIGQSYRTVNDNDYWWLRSPGRNVDNAAAVGDYGGVFYAGRDVNSTGCVRPAFNLDLSSIILTSAAEGGKNPATAGTPEAPGDYTGTGWKLTLHDSKMITGIGTAGVSRSGSTITVPYTVTGDNAGTANRISVLITDKAYTASDAVSKYYGNLAITGDVGTSGTGTFTLPTDYDTSWKVYILSEQINDDKKTDYAGTPVEITIPDIGVPVSGITISPKELELKPGDSQKLTHTIAPDNATNKNVTWSTDKASVATVDDGKVTAVDEGEAIITVTTEDGSFADTCKVTVRKDAPVAEECTVTFDANGGKGDMAPQKADKGETIQLKANKFTRSGYSFRNWNTKADGSGEDYNDKASVKLDKNMTLYAQWKKNKYSVTVKTGGKGEASASRTSAEAGKKITIKAIPKAGHKFKKWKVTRGVELKDATKASTSFKMPAKNVTVKAVFEKIYKAPQPEIKPEGDDAITIAWWTVDEAEGYDIFMSRCDHDGKKTVPKLVATVKGNKTTGWKATGLKPNKAYKASVRAYIKKDGKKKYISKSPLMHVYTAGGNKTHTNAKSIKLDTGDGKIKKGNRLTLNVKDTYRIKASVKKVDKKKKLMDHVKPLRYRSSDPGIATVSSKGKITAKRKGKCSIYVYTHNGINKTIKVTVK